jgi:hypothetical protein
VELNGRTFFGIAGAGIVASYLGKASGPDWTDGADAGRVQNQHEWLASFWKNMRPYASGQAYYGANYARLARVKTTYDPQRLFSFPQAVLRGQAGLGDDLTHLGEGVA